MLIYCPVTILKYVPSKLLVLWACRPAEISLTQLRKCNFTQLWTS